MRKTTDQFLHYRARTYSFLRLVIKSKVLRIRSRCSFTRRHRTHDLCSVAKYKSKATEALNVRPGPHILAYPAACGKPPPQYRGCNKVSPKPSLRRNELQPSGASKHQPFCGNVASLYFPKRLHRMCCETVVSTLSQHKQNVSTLSQHKNIEHIAGGLQEQSHSYRRQRIIHRGCKDGNTTSAEVG